LIKSGADKLTEIFTPVKGMHVFNQYLNLPSTECTYGFMAVWAAYVKGICIDHFDLAHSMCI